MHDGLGMNHPPLMTRVCPDVSDRKLSKAALRESQQALWELNQALERRVNERTAELSMSEAKFRALFERASQGVVLHDENQILEVNPAAVRILGRQSALEVLGKHPGAFAPLLQPNGERSDVVARKYIEETMAQGSARFEWMASSPAGVEIPLEVCLTRIDWSGRQTIQAFITDISERKRAEAGLRASEAQLRESEARFSAAFNGSPVFTSILRMSDGKYVVVNDAFVNWLGCPREEILGRSPTELGLWECMAERDLLTDDFVRNGFLRQRECRWRNRRGELFTILLSVETILLDNVPHMLCLDVDISHRKQAEAELHRTVAREKELSQLKSSFVSMVSHEFRTPLGIIQSSAELLRDFYQRMPDSEREDQLESIIRNTRRMSGMMEEVLVLSRLDAGKLEFCPAPLDLRSFCRRVVDEALSATNRRCPIELSLDLALQKTEADERLLGHIFANLLSNAVKYSEPGATVCFLVERGQREIVFTIRDQGIGIPEPDLQRLFEAFHRGSNVGTRPGTGLGMLVVKRCAELHEGRVSVHSHPGEGTTVTVRLPLPKSNP